MRAHKDPCLTCHVQSPLNYASLLIELRRQDCDKLLCGPKGLKQQLGQIVTSLLPNFSSIPWKLVCINCHHLGPDPEF